MGSEIHYRGCPLCEAMCGLEVEHDGQRVQRIRGDARDPLSEGYVCPKGTQLGALHDDPDRVRAPLRRRGSEWEEIGWDQALDEAASILHRAQTQHGKSAVASYLGNPNVHNYGAMLYGPDFLRTLGSRNRFSATSVDQLPHMLAAYLMFGHQLLMPVPDVDHTDYMVILGANPEVSNGSIMSAPNMKGRLSGIRDRGGEVVVFDPRKTQTAAHASAHHFIRPGTDAHLLASIARELLRLSAGTPSPYASYLRGLNDLERMLAPWTPAAAARVTGVDAAVIEAVARKLYTEERAVCYGRLGVCVQAFGATCGWLLNVINVLSRNLDAPGGAMFALPAFDIIGGPRALGLGRGSFGRWKSRVRGLPEFGGELPAATLAEELDTPGEGQIRALITIAGNPVLSTPNGRRLERALTSLDGMVSVDFYLNETTRHADLILPPTSPLEHGHYDVAFHALAIRNTARYSPPLFSPGPNQRHDWQILSGLESRLLASRGAPTRARAEAHGRRLLQPEGILSLGLHGGPYGLRGDARDVQGRRVSMKRLKRAPHGVDLGPLRPCLPERLGRRSGGARYIDLCPDVLCADLERLEADRGRPARAPEELVLIGRRELRSNNSWMHNIPRLTSGTPRCLLKMHPDDAAVRGLAADDWVQVRSRVGEVAVRLELDDAIMPGVVSLPHGYGHGRDGVRLSVATQLEGASANDLTDESVVDAVSGNAVLSGVPVDIRRADATAAVARPPQGA